MSKRAVLNGKDHSIDAVTFRAGSINDAVHDLEGALMEVAAYMTRFHGEKMELAVYPHDEDGPGAHATLRIMMRHGRKHARIPQGKLVAAQARLRNKGYRVEMHTDSPGPPGAEEKE